MPADRGDWLSGTGRDPSQAETDETSSSVSRLATIYMQSGAMAVRVPYRHAPSCALM